MDALGKVLEGCSNVIILQNVFLRGDEFRPMREQCARYALLSVNLLVKAARDIDKVEDLVQKGFIKERERYAIESAAPYQRAMVCWAWILRVNDEAFMRAELPPGKQAL